MRLEKRARGDTSPEMRTRSRIHLPTDEGSKGTLSPKTKFVRNFFDFWDAVI